MTSRFTTGLPSPASLRRSQGGRACVLGLTVAAALLGFAHAQSALAQAAATASAPDDQMLETIVVTARKRNESLADVPTSITEFSAATLQEFNIQSFNDYATKTPNVSFSYGGGPTGFADARTVAIRGITGQNLTGTAGATGFYIDDTPVPGSVDPRVLDINDIEVLKGPQGTLFGESSLGGNVRLVTRKPNLTEDEYGFMAQGGLTDGGGSPDGGGNFIGNLVLVPNTLAVRMVLFVDHDAGYLTRTYPNPASPLAVGAEADATAAAPRLSDGNQGAQGSGGGSLAALWRITDSFDATLRVMFQDTSDHGFPAAFAPLPGFTPDYTLNRAFNVQPEASDDWALPSLDLKYSGQGWSVVSSSSFFYRHTSDIEDSTYGTQQALNNYYGVPTGTAAGDLPAQPYLWDGEHYHNQLTEEARFSFDPWHNWSGTFGTFYSTTHTRFTIPPTYATGLEANGYWPSDEIWQQTNPGKQKDTSLFGELYYKFWDKFNLTLGAREYWLAQDADYIANGFMNGGLTPSDPTHNSERGFSPKVSLSYQATDDAMVYGSASKGFRAGGAQAFLSFCQSGNLTANEITDLKSDTLWTYELGTKIQLPQPGLLLTAAAYHIDWNNLQQQVALPCGFYFDVNGKQARINGAELELDGRLARDLQLRLGVGVEHTDINDPGNLGSVVGILPGTRIMGTPAFNASLGSVYSHALSPDTKGFISADYAYTGNSTSLVNGGFDKLATRAGYSLVNMRFGVDRGQSEYSINVRNLTNAKPNLGDIGYVGYAQYEGNQAQENNVIPQVATLPPLTVMLQYQKML